VPALSPGGQRLRLPRHRAGASRDGVVRVSCETDGGGGKAVTLVRSLPLDAAALAAVGNRLRSVCGSGGTVKDDVFEVQGETMSSV
jgi:translation initiation factor 1